MRWASFVVGCVLVASGGSAATFTVTTVGDDPPDGCSVDCSLREAVIAANASVEHDTIVVPAGVYTLARVGAGEDAAATGDLDLLEDVSIEGDPAGGTVVDGHLSDRVFHVMGAAVELSSLSVVRGRTAGDFYGAGGILVESGALTMTACTLSDCATDGHGGGVFSLGTVVMDRCTVRGTTGSHGGAIYHAGPGLTLSNSTVSGNTALSSGAGGVHADGLGGSFSITNCTISDNIGPEASALSVRTGLTVTNTILDGDCTVVAGMGSIQSQGGNLESPGDTCDLNPGPDLFSVTAGELNLAALADNGGTTLTHALLPGSLAVNAASNAPCPAVDQRGWLRHDGLCDIGAFEADAHEPVLFADGFELGSSTSWATTVP